MEWRRIWIRHPTETAPFRSLGEPLQHPNADRLDPGFDPRRTVNFGRMVEQWGQVPLAYLAQFATCQYTYGYIGSDDLTMYPILPPGSFVPDR